MRKTFFLILLVVILGHYQQVFAQMKFEYGIKFGINLADMRTEEKTLSPRSSFHFGMEAEYPLSENLGLQSELLVSRQGNVRRGRTNQGVKFDNTLILDYINLPLLVNYYVSDGLHVSMGTQVGFLVRAKLEEVVGVNSQEKGEYENYKNTDFSAVFGAGYKTDWGFVVGFRYNLGFINVLKNPNLYTDRERNSVLQLSMSYRFN